MGSHRSRSANTRWSEFLRTHLGVLAGTDFFTVEVPTWSGLVTYYVLFFIELGSRRVSIAGITEHPDSVWMEQMAPSKIWPEIHDAMAAASREYVVLDELHDKIGGRLAALIGCEDAMVTTGCACVITLGRYIKTIPGGLVN